MNRCAMRVDVGAEIASRDEVVQMRAGKRGVRIGTEVADASIVTPGGATCASSKR